MMEDIIDDPKLASVDGDTFRFFIRLLAMLNRTKSRDGVIFLDRFALNACAMREQRRHALRIARSGAAAGLYRMSEDGLHVSIEVCNWSKLQELRPTGPRQTPDKAPSPKTTPNLLPLEEKNLESTSGSDSLSLDLDSDSSQKVNGYAFRAQAAWPEVREMFAKFGNIGLRSKPGSGHLAAMVKRLKDGATDADLPAAVRGYVHFHQGLEPTESGFNPRQYFNPGRVFRREGFDDLVDLGRDPKAPIPDRPTVEHMSFADQEEKTRLKRRAEFLAEELH